MFFLLLPVLHVSFPLRFSYCFFFHYFLVFTLMLEIVVAVWRRILCLQGGGGRGMSKPRLMLHRFRALLDFKCLSPSVDELIFPVSSPLFLVDYSFFVFSFIMIF